MPLAGLVAAEAPEEGVGEDIKEVAFVRGLTIVSSDPISSLLAVVLNPLVDPRCTGELIVGQIHGVSPLLIRQQYDQMVKYATALRLGTAETEAILRRFTRNNVQLPTYKRWLNLARRSRRFSSAAPCSSSSYAGKSRKD